MKEEEAIRNRLTRLESMPEMAVQEMDLTMEQIRTYCAALWWVLQDD